MSRQFSEEPDILSTCVIFQFVGAVSHSHNPLSVPIYNLYSPSVPGIMASPLTPEVEYIFTAAPAASFSAVQVSPLSVDLKNTILEFVSSHKAATNSPAISISFPASIASPAVTESSNT